jgi:hypothetical protein
MTADAELTSAEIIAALRRLRYDPANGRGKGRKVPLKWIAAQAHIDRTLLYRAVNDGRLSDSARQALSPVLLMLQKRV